METGSVQRERPSCMPKISKRRDEEFARAALHELIAQSTTAIEWEPVTAGAPDYFVSIDGARFAVEITAVMEKIEIGGKRRPAAGISRSLFRFVDCVEKEAREAGILSGAYALSVSPVDDLSSRCADLKAHIFEYLKTTSSVDQAPRRFLYEGGGNSWWIAKFGPHKDCIGGLVGSGGKWEGEANQDVRALLAERVTAKERKLAGVREPAILVLLDVYHFADDNGWLRAISDQVRSSRFSAVIRVRHDGWCQPLCSREPWPLS